MFLGFLAEYGPLINQIYQKFIRHDLFAALVLEPDVSQKARRHDLYLRLRSYSGETKYTPASYLSEAQLNILALSIFLTRVMYQNISELETVFIDDPIQQMDDMNAAAFVDVILGLSQIGKQIIITTCNHDFYRLVAHKMQSVSSAGKVSFKAVDLDSGYVN
jgi:exonuclease SbcC